MTTLTQYRTDPTLLARVWAWIKARKAQRNAMFERGDNAIKEALKFALQGKWEAAMEQYRVARIGISAAEVPIEAEFERLAYAAGKMEYKPTSLRRLA